jgi:hypothetical protein
VTVVFAGNELAKGCRDTIWEIDYDGVWEVFAAEY